MPYGFYQFVRFAAIFAFAYLGFTAKEKNIKKEMFIYIALAILFQPFIKIALGRTIWNIVDIITVIGLVISVIKDEKSKLGRLSSSYKTIEESK
jgi:hypothetical protein